MVKIRMSRGGSKKRPVYHMVVQDVRARRDGRYIECLGYYIPGREVMVLDTDRVTHWVGNGAQLTPTAKRLVAKHRRTQPTEQAAA